MQEFIYEIVLIVDLDHVHSLFPELTHCRERRDKNLWKVIFCLLFLGLDLTYHIDQCNSCSCSSNAGPAVYEEATRIKWFVLSIAFVLIISSLYKRSWHFDQFLIGIHRFIHWYLPISPSLKVMMLQLIELLLWLVIDDLNLTMNHKTVLFFFFKHQCHISQSHAVHLCNREVLNCITTMTFSKFLAKCDNLFNVLL